MKSAIAVATFSAATISLQGCGDGGTATATLAPSQDFPCPGGSLSNCMAVCPSSPLSVFSACVQTCGDRCEDSTTTPVPPSPNTTAPPTPTTTAPPACIYTSTIWECQRQQPLSTTFVDIQDPNHPKYDATIKDNVLTISGVGWSTSSHLDPATCSGSVDFNVPIKTDPQLTNLTVTLLSSYASQSGQGQWSSGCISPSSYVLSFSRPGDTTFTPLNQWVDFLPKFWIGTNYTGFPQYWFNEGQQYLDILHGDHKLVNTDCTALRDPTKEGTCDLTITPKSGNWTVHAKIWSNTCSGMVDFNVPGYPNPPARPLVATFRISRRSGQPVVLDWQNVPEYFIEFTLDGNHVNQWVEVDQPAEEGSPGVLPKGLQRATAGPAQSSSTGAPNFLPSIVLA